MRSKPPFDRNRPSHLFRVYFQSMTTKRPKRIIKRSSRAQEILDSGETLLGSPLTSEDCVSYITEAGSPASVITPKAFIIYNWEPPRPQNFLTLSERRKRWKDRVDRLERQADVDDGSDDWTEVCGAHGMSLERIVANVFKHRAKRAFWAGQSWEQFETSERLCKATKRIDKVRLAVFEVLKYRLCEEIWLEPYREPGASVASQDREDSKMESSEDKGDQPDFEISDEDEG